MKKRQAHVDHERVRLLKLSNRFFKRRGRRILTRARPMPATILIRRNRNLVLARTAGQEHYRLMQKKRRVRHLNLRLWLARFPLAGALGYMAFRSLI
jgi:hypothetical protein